MRQIFNHNNELLSNIQITWEHTEHALILTLLVLEWDLLSPLRCLWDDDEDDEEEEGGRECVGGKTVGTAVLPSILRELLSLLLLWRPMGSSDSGESKGGRSFLGCFFEELIGNSAEVSAAWKYFFYSSSGFHKQFWVYCWLLTTLNGSQDS